MMLLLDCYAGNDLQFIHLCHAIKLHIEIQSKNIRGNAVPTRFHITTPLTLPHHAPNKLAVGLNT